MTYLVDEFYDNSDEKGVRWNDPALGVDWGARRPDPVEPRFEASDHRGDSAIRT